MNTIKIPALEFHQGKSKLHRMFCFVIDGKKIHDFASISRIKRDANETLIGYQRPEVLNHVREIRRYLDESDGPMIPNAIVVSFTKNVSFEHNKNVGEDMGSALSASGTLSIIINGASEEDRPGWIVDGQQRTAAIRDANLTSFPVCVVAFVASNDAEQREHFVRVNSAKPLPKDLIFELLPETDGLLPRQYLGKREAARITGRLNSKPDSPFYRRIRMPTCPTGIISYRAILKMIENSFREGALYDLTAMYPQDADKEIFSFLCDYWTAVSETFQDAWNLIPARSRLTHGCGISAMGYLMDEIGHKVGLNSTDRRSGMRNELFKIKSRCSWTSGAWIFDNGSQITWNGIQNTPKDITMLTNKILNEYRQLSIN